MPPGIDPDFNRLDSLLRTHPAIARVRDAAGDRPVFLVGGAIRDALAGGSVDDIDLVVEGDPVPLARTIDPETRVNDRFGTVKLLVDGLPVDVATARTETYARPGALPDVTPGKLDDDLIRRDFSINAMAIGIEEGARLVDPFGGVDDLRSGVLRVLHDRSFQDDPTRALRAARYAARLDFDLEPRTADLMMAVNLSTVSRDRVESELRLIALETEAIEALRLARRWGLIEFDEGRLELAREALTLTRSDPWKDEAPPEVLILEAIFGDPVDELLPEPETPWEACRVARGHGPVELVLARARGASWLDRWQADWRWVELEITGADLLAEGVPEGPWIGEGLDAALEAKLNGTADGAEAELEKALAVAGRGRT